MPYTVTLDACVLYPMPVCDTLLRLADRSFFRPVWSEEILDELERVMLDNGRSSEAALKRRAAMADTFPSAAHTFDDYLPIVPPDVHAGDHHVVAVSLAARSNVIVTENVRHFPRDVLFQRFGLDVQTPEQFLVLQMSLDSETFGRILEEQGNDLDPPLSLTELIQRFSRYHEFSNEAHERYCGSPLFEAKPLRVPRRSAPGAE